MATAEVSDEKTSSGPAMPPEDTSAVGKRPDADAKTEPVFFKPRPNPEYVTGAKLFLIVSAMAFASFLGILDNMIVSTAIPRITNEFHSLADVGWYASAYQFGSAAPQPLTGRIYKYFNTKRAFLVFFAVFEIGSVICGAAISSPMFIVGRFIAGFGNAGIATGAIAIISNCAPLQKRPMLIGLTMGFNLLGLVLGPLIGGAFTSYSTWRWCFYVNVPVGAAAILAIAFLHTPEESIKPKARTLLLKLHQHLDLVGFFLFAPAVLQLLLALQFGGQAYPWSSSQVIGLFCGAAATAVVWFFWNLSRRDDAMLPLAMINQKNVLASGIYIAFLMSAVFGAIYYLPIYFQAVKGASAMLSAVYLLPMIVSQLITAAMAGAAVSKIGYVIPVAVISTVFLSAGTGLYSLLQPDTPDGQWIGFQILGGIGFGAGLQLPIIAVQAAMDGEELASSIAFVIFGQAFGPTITMTLYNIIFLETLKTQIPLHAPGVEPEAIVRAGVSGFRSFVSAEDLTGVTIAYANSIDRIFYLAAGLAAACGIFLWGMGWHDVRKKEGASKDAEGDGKGLGQSAEDGAKAA